MKWGGVSKDAINYYQLDDKSLAYWDARDTFYHEVGHKVDSFYGEISETSEFHDIWSEEVEDFRLTAQHCVVNANALIDINTPGEYFASAFACYFTFSSHLRAFCPQTYEVIDRLVE